MIRRMSLITILCLGFALALVRFASADDTEIYGSTSSTVKPNVLIIFDNSGSMNDEVPDGAPYDPNTTYPAQNDCKNSSGNTVNCSANQVYKHTTSNGNDVYTTYVSMSTVQSNCATAYTALSTAGQYQGLLRTNGNCTNSNGTYVTGNWVNWLPVGSATSPKIDIAKSVVTNLINTTTGVKFGVLIFNDNGDSSGSHDHGHSGGGGGGGTPLASEEGARFLSYNGYTAYVNDMTVGTNKSKLISAINHIDAETYTPLAESLFEAMRYYKGQSTAYPAANGSITYTSPIEADCQLNYVLIVTDGMSTHDRNSVLTSICTNGDCNNDNDAQLNQSIDRDGSHYLDDVARYMRTNDMNSSFNGMQTVTTYTVGFGLDGGEAAAVDLLEKTASEGGGEAFLATNTQQLSQKLSNIIGSILATNSSFVAPVVPVSPSNKTYSGNNVYVGFFRPNQTGFWSGNIKKYGIQNGIIVDKNGNAATDSYGNFKSSAQSYWSTAPDGPEVEAGGVGDLLSNRDPSTRLLYTYLGTNSSLTNSSNLFTKTNAGLTPAMFGYGASDTTSKNNMIDYVYGYDVFGANPSATRDWIMGDVLHSRPVVVSYNQNLSVIYAGSNDGMLHAFEDNFGTNSSTDGKEKWGFIPQDVISNLDNLTGSVHGYFVDGAPAVYINDANNDGQITTGGSDQVILVFGEHRGGGAFWAIDVTDPNSPVFKWKIDSATSGFSELGQSWSQPQIGKMNIGGTTKQVMIIGGGYDDVHEDTLPPTADTKGRAVYAVDVTTGAKIWEYSYATSVTNDAGSTKDDMTYAIPSDVTIMDTNIDGLIDRVYVGDVGGRMWRFDVGNSSTSSWTGKIIFKSNPGNDSSTGRKIFYPPDVTFEANYQFLFFGTGDREHPVSSTTVVDRLYAVRDYSASGFITEGSSAAAATNQLMDVTSNLLQDPGSSSSTINTTTASLAGNGGWYIRLTSQTAEKDLSTTIVLNKVVTFTTYAPLQLTSNTTCSANLGTGYAYSLNYQNGNSVYDYNSNSSVGLNDRASSLGAGIPSGVVITITPNLATGLVGVGGGIDTVQVPSTDSANKIYWHELF